MTRSFARSTTSCCGAGWSDSSSRWARPCLAASYRQKRPRPPAGACGESLGKRVIVAPDRAGFIVNLLLVPYLLDAIRALEAGVGTREDIDTGMMLGCGMPMGPLTLLDFVGLDTTYYIANIMFDEFRETRFAPPPLLKRLVLAGHHGKKTGRGFYDHSDPANPKPLF